MRLGPAWVLLILLGASFAGCLSGPSATPQTNTRLSPAPPAEPISNNAAKPADPNGVNASFSAGQRWHFHNYWGTSPNLTLFDANVDFQNGIPDVSCCSPVVQEGRLDFRLAQGKIVPPETGRIDIKLQYNASPLLGNVNVSYRPSNARNFIGAGTAKPMGSIRIAVAPDMADVPHRGRSLWVFRLEAAPGAGGVGVANGTVHVTIVATIGRPIFIDPPHIDNWQGANALHEVATKASARVAKTADGTYFDANARGAATSVAEFPLVNGSIVPEGTQTLLARLRWTNDAPLPAANDPTSLVLTYSEENAGTKGSLQLVKDSAGERVFKLNVEPRTTDNPYSNRSTWTIYVQLDSAAGAFSGTLQLDVWAARLPSDVATVPAGSSSASSDPSGAPPFGLSIP